MVRRGQVYKDAGRLVDELVYEPSFLGRPDTIKENILSMVSLVKTKLGRAKVEDKKSWKAWLKTAEKQLLYHRCDRAWLTADVFQLENTRRW